MKKKGTRRTYTKQITHHYIFVSRNGLLCLVLVSWAESNPRAKTEGWVTLLYIQGFGETVIVELWNCYGCDYKS